MSTAIIILAGAAVGLPVLVRAVMVFENRLISRQERKDAKQKKDAGQLVGV